MDSIDSHFPLAQSNSTPGGKTTWSLTQTAFDKLLSAFSSDRDEAGARYESMRRKIVRFFEWRAIGPADDYTDETFNRVARRIDEGEQIANLSKYIYAVARLILMEALKHRERAPVPLPDDLSKPNRAEPPPEDAEARLTCLDRCLESLTPNNRKLIVDYYQEDGRAKIEMRQELADRLQIPLNALRIRAHRIRMSLEKCITDCMQAAVAK